MEKIGDNTQHTNGFEVEQIQHSKVKFTTHTKLTGWLFFANYRICLQ